MKFFPEDWGNYPKEYNREIHGPYNPSVYYGKLVYQSVRFIKRPKWVFGQENGDWGCGSSGPAPTSPDLEYTLIKALLTLVAENFCHCSRCLAEVKRGKLWLELGPLFHSGSGDTPLGDVKLGEFFGWLSRRNKSPRAMAAAISRAWFRYRFKWVSCKKPGPAFLYQRLFLVGFAGFLMDYSYVKRERAYRYH